MREHITTNNYLLIKIIEPAKQTLTGIHLAEKYEEKPRWGWVLDVGEGLSDARGDIIKPDFEPGDLVYFMQHAPEKMDYSDKGLGVLHFISECDVTVKLKIAQNEDGSKSTTTIPIGNFVQIEPMEDTVKRQTEGGIFLPDQVIERPSVARVISVGRGQKTMTGYFPPKVNPGDIVRYRTFATQSIHFDALSLQKKPITIIPYGDILAVEVPDFEKELQERINKYSSILEK